MRAEAFLSAYASTYLDQEIRAESVTRNVGAFSRFLEVAARQNGQATNTSTIARESGVARALSGRLPYPPTNEEAGPLLGLCRYRNEIGHTMAEAIQPRAGAGQSRSPSGQCHLLWGISGSRTTTVEGVQVLPVELFLAMLRRGEVIR